MPCLTRACIVGVMVSVSNPCLALTIRVPSEMPTLQDGLNVASPGDTVLAAPGTYSGEGNRDLDFAGKDIVFQSEAGAAATVIECDDAGSAMIFRAGETSACMVKGFTMQHSRYGAVYCDGASPTFVECTFFANAFDYKLYTPGGAAILESASPSFLDCRFEWNSSYDGGAVWCQASDVRLERCTFLNNGSAYGGGGAIVGYDGSSLALVDCAFEGNATGGAGGSLLFSSSSATCERCAFRDGWAHDDGGCVAAYGPGSLVFRECSFAGHESRTGMGGAIACSGDLSIDLQGVMLAQNRALGGSAMVLRNDGSSSLEAVLDRVIISFGGTAPDAVACQAGVVTTVLCCDVYGNQGGDWVGCLQGLEGQSGNFSADPLFCDLASGDLTLDASSPCLPGQHPGGGDCGLIGALGSGCGEPTVVQPSTWGSVKARFAIK